MHTTLFRTFLPHIPKIGSSAWRRKVLEMIPIQSIKTATAMVDVMHSAGQKIIRETNEALEKGDDAVHELVSEGKDIMSVLCTSSLIHKVQLSFIWICVLVKANMQAEDNDKLSDSVVSGQVK